MHLKSLTLKGFKSFPDRTRLDFGPGVSVVVGPNGSGKSNVTDAVLWAMGEQSPLAIRGQSMQDVIFGGGRGVQPRNAAEVEIVLDNSDGTVDLPLSEISILRKLDRSGEGEYRLNGARCRLVDVLEVLSDTGLGKETHSVVSQGRVEAIVTSKPRDRRLLIEEAAGLGKHRKRRRRAQLKLERTQENLDRALDVEREARSRLRPLKRQAEAAELHERLELQSLQARLELAREAVRSRRLELKSAETAAQAARAARTQVEVDLQAVIERRTIAERALAERAEQHDALARRAYDARSARDRLELRCEQARTACNALAQRITRVELELQTLSDALAPDGEAGRSEQGQQAAMHNRIATLEAELAELERRREQETERELADLLRQREQATARIAELELEQHSSREARKQADAAADGARERLRAAEREVESARREAARVGAELAAANQFLRSHARFGSAGESSPRALSETLQVRSGYELALAAALGGRLDAALVRDLAGAAEVLDSAGPDGGTALLAGDAAHADAGSGANTDVDGGAEANLDSGADAGAEAGAGARASSRVASANASAQPPSPGAERLLELVRGPGAVLELAERLLADAWVVERLDDLPASFNGIAVTRAGRVWFAALGEVRQVTAGGAERVLARRNERDQLIAASETAAQAEHAARQTAERALEELRAADVARDQADQLLRDTDRRRSEIGEEQRRAGWLIEQRRAAPQQGPLAVRRAELEGELASERRQAERLQREHAARVQRQQRLQAQYEADVALVPLGERLIAVLQAASATVAERVEEFEAQLSSDRAAGEQVTNELRTCAGEEAQLQARLRVEGEAVTGAEVAAQRLRDQASEAELELGSVSERLELPLPDAQQLAAAEPLGAEETQALTTRLERLARRREQLGPVNPLAQDEYAEALAHVEELETRRADLETALRELRSVIRDTDRQIHETFEATFSAAARNFQELVGDVFPGGSGQLRLVKDEQAPRPVLGGQQVSGDESETDAQAADAAEAAADAEAEREQQGEEELLGVEIEITPAGKSTKRLSLLSGGEKSMTALAFLFAVFLARPCPFYILDEVEAALDDLNLDRFLALLRRYAGRAQFLVITHQKRTMEAADWLYGVSMGGDGVSKILSRRLPQDDVQQHTEHADAHTQTADAEPEIAGAA
ncbi:MAG TPA: AAA family ATPase [Solirubrobacteraceae bacterium]|nr:AAA family ATPase [Solirubrobacteraceae bacterium]